MLLSVQLAQNNFLLFCHFQDVLLYLIFLVHNAQGKVNISVRAMDFQIIIYTIPMHAKR